MDTKGNVYFCLHIHCNFWYAEYTHEQAIRQFLKLYEGILDVFERHHGGAACWDFETQLTLDIIRESAPHIIQRLDALAAKGTHDLIPCTWATALATHLTREEFDFNLKETLKQMKLTFKLIAPTWISQDGGFSPQFVSLLKSAGMEYQLIDHRILNRHYQGQYSMAERFRPNLIQGSNGESGSGENMPCLFFGIEGLNSYGDFAEAFKKQLMKVKEIQQTHPDMNFFIYPFIDAERIDPPKLDKWLTQIEALGAKYCSPSQFLKLEPNTGRKFEFDVGDWHDWSFHNDILADQRLFTLIERARDKLEEVEWWKSKIEEFGVSIDEKNRIKYDQMLEEAMRAIHIAQGSDKTHWYASQHKMDIGQKNAVLAFENASYIAGIYSYLLSQTHTFLPDRPQAMKDPSLNLTLLNPFKHTEFNYKNKENERVDLDAYPKYFPVGLEFPYIVTVNLNTKPWYEIQDYPQKCVKIPTPTIFNIVPGLSVHNIRTELFFQLKEPLGYGSTMPLKIVPLDDEIEFNKPQNHTLENEFIKVILTPSGDILKIINKTTGVTFTRDNLNENEGQNNNQQDQLPIIHPSFDCQIPGCGTTNANNLELINSDSDMVNSLVYERQSNEQDGSHRLKLTTKYRVFSQFPALLMDSIANIAGPLPGYYCPCEIEWNTDSSKTSITRDVLSASITSPKLLPRLHQIFLNDWCIMRSSNGHQLGIAFDKKIHSCKQMLFRPAGKQSSVPRFSLGFMRHFPEWVAQNLLSGIVFQRIWIVPFDSKLELAQNIDIMRMLTKPPVLGWYL